MSIDQSISLLASIGACLSAIVALFIVFQNSRQNKASYKPELVLKKVSFLAEPGTSVPEDWKNTDIDIEPNNFFSIPLLNIGLGSAKKIKIYWNFPVDDFICEINKIAQESLIPAYLENKNGLVTLKSDSLHSSLSMWNNQKTASTDYVLPASIDSDGFGLNLPPAYILLVSSAVFFFSKLKERDDFPNIPNLILEIKYLDLGNNTHKNKYNLNTSIFSVEWKESDQVNFHGLIESEKIK